MRFLIALSAILFPAAADAQAPVRGQAVYARHCAQCHGLAGTPYRLDPRRPGEYLRDARGAVLIDTVTAPAAPFAHPRPRDLASGVYKLRTTATGELPLDSDIVRTISQGMPGSSMPAWKEVLTEAEISDVAAYVKAFSKRFDEGKPGRVVEIKPLPKTAESIKNGETLYLSMNCFLCHGISGRGDGEIGLYRRDASDQDNKVSASDLTKRWNLRAGPRLEDIYKSIMTGLTLMPSHEEAFAAGPQARRQAWDLAYYVDSLSRDKPNASGLLRAHKITGALPVAEKDPLWNTIPADDVFMAGQVIAPTRHYEPSVDLISVRGLYNSEELALLLEWHDPRKNIAPIPDSVQIQLPFELGPEADYPHFLDGDLGHAAALWTWDARTDLVTSARAFGPLGKRTPLAASDLRSSSSFSEGRWRLLITRRLKAAAAQGPVFPEDRPIPIAFSAWDGDPEEREEAGMKRALSGWNALVLLSSPSVVVAEASWLQALRPEAPGSFMLRGKPVEFAQIKNPYAAAPAGQAARADGAREGKALYAQKCLSCHGAALNGRGQFAKAFYPRPADLASSRAAGDAYSFWRIATGGPGLPRQARPWSSAMPAWANELDDAALWKLILYLNDAPREEPRPSPGRGP